MRVYLVIIDETEEAGVAMRFAARRARKTGGVLHLLALVPPPPFVAFGSVQATIEEEARSRAEVMVSSAAGDVVTAGGTMPVIAVRSGENIKVVRAYLDEHPVAALVLGAAKDGRPRPADRAFRRSRPRHPALPAIHRAGLAERGGYRPAELRCPKSSPAGGGGSPKGWRRGCAEGRTSQI